MEKKRYNKQSKRDDLHICQVLGMQQRNISNTTSPYLIQQLCIYDYNSGIYQGEYFKNQRQGRGVYYWFSGQMYIGEWHNDFIQGQGTLYFPYSGNFVGFFQNNKAEGPGILTLLDGSRIAGVWKNGRLQGKFVRFDIEIDEWIMLNGSDYYEKGKENYHTRGIIGLSRSNEVAYKREIIDIYENIKTQINTPYYRQMTERIDESYIPQSKLNVNIGDADRFKVRLEQMDEDIFFHGLVRGSRPDGIGILFSMNGRFSVRGKFANTCLNGPGRVEMENGEIYDGVFRNGIIKSGFYFNALFNTYVSGIFHGENEVSLEQKGRGYPYKLALENKQGVFQRMMIYKNTSEEVLFLVQNDIKQLKLLDITKYLTQKEESSPQVTKNRIQSSDLQENHQFEEQGENGSEYGDSQEIKSKYRQEEEYYYQDEEQNKYQESHETNCDEDPSFGDSSDQRIFQICQQENVQTNTKEYSNKSQGELEESFDQAQEKNKIQQQLNQKEDSQSIQLNEQYEYEDSTNRQIPIKFQKPNEIRKNPSNYRNKELYYDEKMEHPQQILNENELHSKMNEDILNADQRISDSHVNNMSGKHFLKRIEVDHERQLESMHWKKDKKLNSLQAEQQEKSQQQNNLNVNKHKMNQKEFTNYNNRHQNMLGNHSLFKNEVDQTTQITDMIIDKKIDSKNQQSEANQQIQQNRGGYQFVQPIYERTITNQSYPREISNLQPANHQIHIQSSKTDSNYFNS